MSDIKRGGLLGFLLSNMDAIATFLRFAVPSSVTGALVAGATWFAGLFQQYSPASWVIAGVLGALAGALIVWLVVLARERLQIIRFRNNTFDASRINPLDTTFQSRRIRIIDLAPPIGVIIEGKTFIDCDILGPANLVFQNCHFHGNSGEVVDAIIVKPGMQPNNGFGFKNCIFRQCRIYSVTFLVPESDYDQFNVSAHSGLNWITERPDQPPLPLKQIESQDAKQENSKA